MTKFIRCIEGHVYDADQSDACPVCGAIPGVEDSGRVPVEQPEENEPTASAKDKAKPPSSKAKSGGWQSGALFGVPRLWLAAGGAVLFVGMVTIIGLSQGEDPETVAQTEVADAAPPNGSEDPAKDEEATEAEGADSDGPDGAEADTAKRSGDDDPGPGEESDSSPERDEEEEVAEEGASNEADNSEQKTADEAAPLRERAIKHFQNRDFDSAIADFTDVIRKGGAGWKDYNMRGMSYHSKDEFDLAMADYERALRVRDHEAPVHYNRMLILKRRGDTKNAIAELDAAIDDHNSTDPSHFIERADLYVDVSELDKAIADYDRTMDLFSKNKATPDADKAVVLYLRGDAKRRKANRTLVECQKIDPKEKKERQLDEFCGYKTELMIPLLDFEASAAVNPNNALTQHRIGWIAMEIGNRDRAIESFTKAIRLDPTLSEAYADRCIVYGLAKQWDLALGDCNDAIRHNSKNYSAWANRGIVYRMKGGRANRKKGIADIRQALKINPDYEYAANLLRQIGVKP